MSMGEDPNCPPWARVLKQSMDEILRAQAELSTTATTIQEHTSIIMKQSARAFASFDRSFSRGSESSKNSFTAFTEYGRAGKNPGGKLLTPTSKLRRTPIALSDVSKISQTSTARSSYGELVPCAVEPLPAGWPGTLRMRKGIEQSANTIQGEQMIKLMVNKQDRNKTRTDDSTRLSTGFESAQALPTSSTFVRKCFRSLWGPYSPESVFIVVFDLLVIFAVMYEIAWVPYALTFDIAFTGMLRVASCMSTAFWSFCLILGFRTGYYHRAVLVMRGSDIARHYLKTWFLPDCLPVMTDWIELAFTILQPSASRDIMRALKICRAIKMVRVPKSWQMAITLFSKLSSRSSYTTTINLVFIMLEVLTVIIVLTHILSCIWIALGREGPADTQNRWLRQTSSGRDSSLNVFGTSDIYLYLTAFHWTIAQLTLGAMEINPVNSAERVFCVSLLVLGLIFSSTVVSAISVKTMELVVQRSEARVKIDTMRRFLAQNNVDMSLAVRVVRQATERLADNAMPLSEQDVPVLILLSTTLREELLVGTRKPFLFRHPLFRLWATLDDLAVEALCMEAVRFTSYSPQDRVFVPSDHTDHAFFVAQGTLRYSQYCESSYLEDDVSTLVRQGTWLCEAALWTHWIHTGSLDADTGCQVMMVGAYELLQIISRFKLVTHLTRSYGRAFHWRVVFAAPPHAPWPSDLHVAFTHPSDLMLHEIGEGLLRRACEKGELVLNDDTFEKLLHDLHSERCSVVEEDGELLRVVSVVVLKLFRFDQRFLVQVGCWDYNKGAEKLQDMLPGTKRARGELPSQALERILKYDLSPFAEYIRVVSSEVVVEETESHHYGIRTKYLRAVNTAELSDDFDFLRLKSVVRNSAVEPPRLVRARQMKITSLDRLSKPTTEEPADKTALSQDIFVISDGNGRIILFSWLNQLELDFLQTDEGTQLLQERFSLLEGIEEYAARDHSPKFQSVLSDCRTEPRQEPLTRITEYDEPACLSHELAHEGSVPVSGTLSEKNLFENGHLIGSAPLSGKISEKKLFDNDECNDPDKDEEITRLSIKETRVVLV